MTRRKDPAETRIPVAAEDLPAFDSVPVKYRHDGWTPARQKAFIGALADTGSVSRAARYVNMSPEGAYYLRRRPGSESFRRAWEAAANGRSIRWPPMNARSTASSAPSSSPAS